MSDEDIKPNMARRSLVGLAAVGAIVATTAASCGSDGGSGSTETQNVTNANTLTDQQVALTVNAYNDVRDNPECDYPAQQLDTSLELQNQRKKLIMFNQAGKLGWVYLISMGNIIAEIPVVGKISSINSSMTANVGAYIDSAGTNGAAGVPVQLPGDDLSFGPNEGGDKSVFFYTVDGVYINWTGDYLYSDSQLTLLTSQLIKYQQGNQKPAN